MHLRRDVPLAPHTTFELGGPARLFVEVAREAELVDALAHARRDGVETLILGGGSNLVVADEGFDGLAIKIASRGIDVHDDEGRALVTCAAGERWDDLVAATVERDLAGLECLSGIPGLVGATPIQNVGAYGQEVADTIVEVRTIDARTGERRVRGNADCAFSYRHSIFKTSARDEVVTSVTFALRRGGGPKIRYPELERALAAKSAAPSLREVRDTVVALRRSKSMVLDREDPNRRSAGSFFVNPIVPATKADDVAARAVAAGAIASAHEMPRFPAGADVKLSAGWLIERAGMAKGTRRGNVGISSRHALALVHHGGGTTRDLLALAREVIDAVHARFDVTLRPEPVIVGPGSSVSIAGPDPRTHRSAG